MNDIRPTPSQGRNRGWGQGQWVSIETGPKMGRVGCNPILLPTTTFGAETGHFSRIRLDKLGKTNSQQLIEWPDTDCRRKQQLSYGVLLVDAIYCCFVAHLLLTSPIIVGLQYEACSSDCSAPHTRTLSVWLSSRARAQVRGTSRVPRAAADQQSCE